MLAGEESVIGQGMFTQTRPDVRRVSPQGKNPNVTVVKVVYVVLEAQYQSSLSAAANNIKQISEF